MNDFFTSGEKLTAFKLNEMFRKISARLDSLEATQNQAARETGYNSGAVTAMPGTPRGLDNPRPAFPPTRHAITPQSFYTQFKTSLWQFPTVGDPNQGIGHEVTSGTDGYDTDSYGSATAGEAVRVDCEASITDFYPVSWTDAEENEYIATAAFGVEWESGEGNHFLHLQGEEYSFSNTYDPETGSITWSQPLGEPRALPWGQGGGQSGRWHYFQTDLNTILPTAISSYSKTDGEFASIHYAKDGTSTTAEPTEDASYALYDKPFINGAKFKRLRQGFGTELSEEEGIITVDIQPWEVWYDTPDPYASETEEDSGHKSITGFGWYGFHAPAHESHAVNGNFQISPGSGTVWWHVYNSEEDLASNTSATSKFGLSVMVDEGADGRARVAFQAEGGVVIPSGVTDTPTSWTTAYAISNTADFGDYGIAAHGDTGLSAFFAHAGTGSVTWHVTDAHSSVTGEFGFSVGIKRATDIYPDGARVRLTPFGGIQLPARGATGLESFTTYISAVSMTAPETSPQLFDGHIVIPSDQNSTLSGRIAEWHLTGIGRIGLQLTATTYAGEAGVSLTYAPYMIHNT